MAEPYLKELQAIVERWGVQSKETANPLCKHFFSVAAAYVNGQIFMTLTAVGLALKLSEDDRSTLFAQGAKPLKYFPKAPVKKEYALLPSQVIEDESALRDWISRSIAFVRN